ncbi:MAG TPA: hypothetical protein VFC09_04190 [Candidatus Dormibacteraeota bacterium]|nr:hypothetical protein [Candidatus Dormibacteraeota bacterium]
MKKLSELAVASCLVGVLITVTAPSVGEHSGWPQATTCVTVGPTWVLGQQVLDAYEVCLPLASAAAG